MEKIKFNLYHVICGAKKAKVYYSFDNSREVLTVCAKEYGQQLRFLPGVKNDTDTMTDYFEKDRVRLTKESPYYADAMAAYAKYEAKRASKNAEREAAYQNMMANYNRRLLAVI